MEIGVAVCIRFFLIIIIDIEVNNSMEIGKG